MTVAPPSEKLEAVGSPRHSEPLPDAVEPSVAGEKAPPETEAPQTTQPFSMSASRIEAFTSIACAHSGQTKSNSTASLITDSHYVEVLLMTPRHSQRMGRWGAVQRDTLERTE